MKFSQCKDSVINYEIKVNQWKFSELNYKKIKLIRLQLENKSIWDRILLIDVDGSDIQQPAQVQCKNHYHAILFNTY